MIFTSYTYIFFLSAIFIAYWLLRAKTAQNLLLLVGSYVFYGYVHPWFCLLIAASTAVDYCCGLGMLRRPEWRKYFLIFSLIFNLGMLGVFKYFNFFADNVQQIFSAMHIEMHPITFQIFLPVGISFYTFQTLSYTIDIYRGKLEPRKNFLDFAVFVAFFPQLVAGPIERAVRFLPQVESPRRWKWEIFFDAWPLLVSGFLKKMVIADNVAIYADKIYMLESPSLFLLLAGTLAFTVQILADFSAYTDIARGSARLLGFHLIENFKSPYLSISPSDFWRRWHISFSSWIRDYLYISLGGSRVATRWMFLLVVLVSMGLSGLWHGAAWHFVLWGIYHALLLFAYHALSLSGRWEPRGWPRRLGAWALMFGFTVLGWMIFRASSVGWLLRAFGGGELGLSGDSLMAGMAVLGLVFFYSMPLYAMLVLDRFFPKAREIHAVFYGLALIAITLFSRDVSQDFIYFQF